MGGLTKRDLTKRLDTFLMQGNIIQEYEADRLEKDKRMTIDRLNRELEKHGVIPVREDNTPLNEDVIYYELRGSDLPIRLHIQAEEEVTDTENETDEDDNDNVLDIESKYKLIIGTDVHSFNEDKDVSELMKYIKIWSNEENEDFIEEYKKVQQVLYTKQNMVDKTGTLTRRMATLTNLVPTEEGIQIRVYYRKRIYHEGVVTRWFDEVMSMDIFKERIAKLEQYYPGSVIDWDKQERTPTKLTEALVDMDGRWYLRKRLITVHARLDGSKRIVSIIRVITEDGDTDYYNITLEDRDIKLSVAGNEDYERYYAYRSHKESYEKYVELLKLLYTEDE